MRRKDNQQPKEHKQFTPIQLKIDEAQGIVEEIVAVMGNIDEGGDIFHPGAFAKTIQERASKIKVLDQHNTDSIMRILGKPIAMRELSRGELPQSLLAEYPDANGALAVTTQYFMDTPEGKGAFVRVKEGTVEYSIGYDALDLDWGKVEKDGKQETVRNLRTIKLYEYGPVLWGMNPATMTVSAKSEDGKPEDEKQEEKQTPETIAEKRASLTALVNTVETAFYATFALPDKEYYCREVYDDRVIVASYNRSSGVAEYFAVPYTMQDDTPEFARESDWIPGKFEFVPSSGVSTAASVAPTAGLSADDEATEAKAGRVLSRRNAEALRSAVEGLVNVLKGAGVWDDDEDDDDKKPDDEEGKSDKPADAPPGAADQEDKAKGQNGNTRAGPPQAPTTDWEAIIDIEALGIELDKLRISNPNGG